MKQSDSATPKKFRRYKSVPLNAVFDIPKIYTVHYFEYDCNYVFKGESHDFWEILFVDCGSVEVTVENRSMVLEKGSLLFHQPNEFHALRAIGKNPPNLIVVSFDCDSPIWMFSGKSWCRQRKQKFRFWEKLQRKQPISSASPW